MNVNSRILYWNNKRVQKQKTKIKNYEEDLEKEKRLKRHLCKYCMYIDIDRIAGQAFTKSACANCGLEMTFPSTDTDSYCETCAKVLNICSHCGSLMD